MVEINEQLLLRQAEIDRIKTELATPTMRAERAEQRAELFRALVSVQQEYGMLLRVARSRRSLVSKIAASK
jgi:hypothetical protein